MYKFSFVHEDSRIVWAIHKLQNAISDLSQIVNNLLINPIPPLGNIIENNTPDSWNGAADNQMVGMITTLGPGTWLVTFSGDVSSNGAVPNIVKTSIHINGSPNVFSVRNHQFADTDVTVSFASFVSQAKVVVPPSFSTVIQGTWSVTAGQTATSLNRQLSFVKITELP